MTAFIIVLERWTGNAQILSLMASGVSRLISVRLYPSLAELQLQRLPRHQT